MYGYHVVLFVGNDDVGQMMSDGVPSAEPGLRTGTNFLDLQHNPKPCVWKAKGVEILAKIMPARAALDAARAA